MQNIYQESFFLSAGETDAEGRLALPVLVNKIIDIATAHANILGIGNPAMEDKNCGWVLSRLSVEAISLPRANTRYSLATWVESWNRHFSVRSFRLSDDKGETLAYARTIWMVLDMKSRTNYGLSHLHLPEEMILGEKVPMQLQAKHVRILPYGEKAPDALTASCPEVRWKFYYCDLDFYRHVNTVSYVRMILNQFSLKDMDTMRVRRFELSFMHEARAEEWMQLRHAITPDGAHAFYLSDESDMEKPLIFARIFLSRR